MKLTCTQENFKKAIFNSERVVSKQTTLPILNNILFEAEKGGLKISATNLEIGVVVKIGAKIEREGKITIPARLISNFINNLPPGENITIETSEQSLKIKSGSAKAIIKGLPANDFPLVPQKNTDFQLQIEGQEIKNIISKVITAVAINETRAELTGINLILKENELFFAATDSFRLTEYKLDLQKINTSKDTYLALISKKNNIIIPATTLIELNRTISEEDSLVKMAIEEGQIFFENNGTMLVSRLINGKYPEYKHIMPTAFKTRIVGEKSAVQGAVKMASVFSVSKTSEITLKADAEAKKTLIEARNVEVGENSTELKLDITGPSQEVILNSKYLLDGLSSISSPQVAILINSGATPVVLKEVGVQKGEILDDYTYIVMPIKN